MCQGLPPEWAETSCGFGRRKAIKPYPRIGGTIYLDHGRGPSAVASPDPDQTLSLSARQMTRALLYRHPSLLSLHGYPGAYGAQSYPRLI